MPLLPTPVEAGNKKMVLAGHYPRFQVVWRWDSLLLLTDEVLRNYPPHISCSHQFLSHLCIRVDLPLDALRRTIETVLNFPVHLQAVRPGSDLRGLDFAKSGYGS